MGIATKRDDLRQACLEGNQKACMLIRDLPGFAAGGLMQDSSRLWKMESEYPEYQKGIASRVSKEGVPTTPIEEQYMYSPTQQGYAEGGSVYDETGSMLAPEVPLDFEEEVPMDMPVEEISELGLTAEETEVLGQAMSDYPELENILNKISSTMDSEFTGDGAVDGPGTETSDSINAKLSDGEFVFTAKSVKQLGVDKLRKQMAKAEEDYDESSMKQEYQQMGDAGFAAGGFFDRPGYDEGGAVQEGEGEAYKKWRDASLKEYSKTHSFSGSLGTAIMDTLKSTGEWLGRGFDSVMDVVESDQYNHTIDPDTDYESEEYKQHQKDLQDSGI